MVHKTNPDSTLMEFIMSHGVDEHQSNDHRAGGNQENMKVARQSLEANFCEEIQAFPLL